MGQYLCALCCGGVGASIGQVTDDAAKEVGKFMGKVTLFYIKGMLVLKVEDCIDEIVGSVDVREEEPDDEEEVKELEDKETDDVPVIASGVYLTGYKNATGPDTLKHVYYDFSSFAIRPCDSVITRVTFKHSQLKKFNSSLQKKIENCPEDVINAFPMEKKPKKGLGKFHRERYGGLDKYFQGMNKNRDITENEYFLMKFKLVYDEKSAQRRELFMGCLEDVCGDESIDFQEAVKTAQDIGIDLEEVELLKYVAVKKLFGGFAEKIKTGVKNNMPSQAPLSIVNTTIKKGNDSLVKILCSGVETSWNVAIDKTFVQIHSTVSDLLDKVKDPIKEIVLKITDPIGKILKENFNKLEEKTNIDDKNEDLENININRFGTLAAALKELNDGESKKTTVELCNTVMNSIGELNYTYKYINYIRYSMKFKKILEYFPPIKDINEKHTRMCIAMLDIIYVLSRSLVRALMPICKYVDKACEEFDKDKHSDKVRDAVLEAGRNLSYDYFNLPHTIWRACWYCSPQVSNKLLEFARVTVSKMADLIGTIAHEWKPESKDKVRETFAKIVTEHLTEFLGKRCVHMFGIIRASTVDLIADLVDNLFGKTIYKVTEAIDELLGKLPKPLNDINTTKLIKFILRKMVSVTVAFAVKMWSRNTEKYYIKKDDDDDDDDKIEEYDKNSCTSWRIAPTFRDDNYEAPELKFDEDEPQE